MQPAKLKLFTRCCKRCGILFKTPSKSRRAVCVNCNTCYGKILRVRESLYCSVHDDAKKFSKNGLILNPDSIIEAYQKVIKKFKLNKELGKILHEKN